MDSIIAFLTDQMESIEKIILGIHLKDMVDILLVAVVVYYLLILLQRSNAFSVLKGILLFLAIAGVASILKLTMLGFFLNTAMQVGIFALVVLFQPELRRMLEQMGSSTLAVLKREQTAVESAIPQTAQACMEMAATRTGALIVFARAVQLDDYLKTGTPIDASVTSELLKNIFYPKAPLHDGAVIVEGGRIAGAGCVLPLTQNPNISRDLGTRHKAAIGMSELSDAVIVICSEETGVISVAIGGMLKRHLTPETLERLLRNELILDEEAENKKGVKKLLGRFRSNKVNEHE